MRMSLTALSLAVLLAPAGCYGLQNHDLEYAEYADAATIKVTEAIRTATAKVPGQPIKAKLDKEKDRVVYKIDIIDQDKVEQEVAVDALSGKILRAERKVKIVKTAPSDVAPLY
jgi:uncharacterized membrane protein YkoI